MRRLLELWRERPRLRTRRCRLLLRRVPVSTAEKRAFSDAAFGGATAAGREYNIFYVYRYLLLNCSFYLYFIASFYFFLLRTILYSRLPFSWFTILPLLAFGVWFRITAGYMFGSVRRLGSAVQLDGAVGGSVAPLSGAVARLGSKARRRGSAAQRRGSEAQRGSAA